MNKLKISAVDALGVLKDGDSLMVGGFGLVGSPLSLIEALLEIPVKNLTIISNNVGESGKGLGKVLLQGKISKAIGSYFTSNRDAGDLYMKGELELEVVPQGTLAERIRAGGAGIPAFFVPTSAGTALGKGKPSIEFEGRLCVMEKALRADVALVRAHKADTMGNLIFTKTMRNFNPAMATAAKYVIAEVDEVVEVGELDPDEIIVPHMFVDAVIKAEYVLSAEGVVKVDG